MAEKAVQQMWSQTTRLTEETAFSINDSKVYTTRQKECEMAFVVRNPTVWLIKTVDCIGEWHR